MEASSYHEKLLADDPAAFSSVTRAHLDAGRGGQVLYRITFQNYCGTLRSLFWCAEHPAHPVPAAVACAEVRGTGSEVRQLIKVRREFQWHLPAGARVRYLDCPPQEVPTPDFRCAPPSAAPQRR